MDYLTIAILVIAASGVALAAATGLLSLVLLLMKLERLSRGTSVTD